MVEVYRKIRNTSRFILGNLYDFNPAQHSVSYEKLEEIDRLILSQFQNLINMTITADNYESSWTPPICLTESINKKGIDNLAEEILKHKNLLTANGSFEDYFKNKSNNDLKEMIIDYLTGLLLKKLEDEDLYKKLLSDLMNNKKYPYSVAEEILTNFLNYRTSS